MHKVLHNLSYGLNLFCLVDTTAPSCVNLPSGVVETVELGQPGAVVTWTEPTCSDTSGVASVTMRSQEPSTFFPVGMTIVTYTCTDGSGNMDMCSFNVVVTEGNKIPLHEIVMRCFPTLIH